MIRRYKFVLYTLVGLAVMAGVAFAQSQRAAFLNRDSGTVEMRRVQTETWVEVSVESVIGVGDAIRTGSSGSASINLFDSATVTLLPKTTIRIDRLDESEDGYAIGYTVFEGHTEQVLASPDDRPAAFEVKSPLMTVLTRSGQFDVIVGDEDTTTLLSRAGQVFVQGGGGLVEIPPGNGTRTGEDNTLSEIVPASDVGALRVALDGAPVRLNFPGDVLLNVRRGPSKESQQLGTIAPDDVTSVKGTSQDGIWYRIPYDSGSAWISSQGMDISLDAPDTQLAVFPQDYLERAPGERVVSAGDPAAVETPPQTALVPGAALLGEYSMEELQVVARINEYRLSQGLTPLKLNRTLSKMATDQGAFLSGMPDAQWVNDPHTDGQGRNPRERALDPSYNWPAYGADARMAVGEILYTGVNPEAAVTWWKQSDIHNRTMSNAGYREIGIAVYPHAYGSMYLVVFGSRPNIFPALLHPGNQQVFVPTENYQYADGGNWLTSVQEVQFIPTTIDQLELATLTELDDTAWQPWTTVFQPPAGEAYAVAYRQGEGLVIDTVNPAEDIALLPDTLPDPNAEPATDGTAALAPSATPTQGLPPAVEFEPVGTPGASVEANATTVPAENLIFATNTPTSP